MGMSTVHGIYRRQQNRAVKQPDQAARSAQLAQLAQAEEAHRNIPPRPLSAALTLRPPMRGISGVHTVEQVVQQRSQSMSWWEEQEDTTTYKVVMNHEEQYSLWPADRENAPLGWQEVGKRGPKAECLAYIQEVWTDMRPLSLRKQMEEAARQREQPGAPSSLENAPASSASGETPRDDLVQRLCTGSHAVKVILRPEQSAQALKGCIDSGYVQIKFVNTNGGTGLGVRLDPNALDLGAADFARQSGHVHLVGGLILNYVPVRCIADIDLATFTGQGYLEPAEA